MCVRLAWQRERKVVAMAVYANNISELRDFGKELMSELESEYRLSIESDNTDDFYVQVRRDDGGIRESGLDDSGYVDLRVKVVERDGGQLLTRAYSESGSGCCEALMWGYRDYREVAEWIRGVFAEFEESTVLCDDGVVPWSLAWEQMDSGLRRVLVLSSGETTNQRFYDGYCMLHKNFFGDEFHVRRAA